jgi:hypothetical protein
MVSPNYRLILGHVDCCTHPQRRSGVSATEFARRRFLHLAAGTAALSAVSRIAWAQAYPSRPITMIVSVAPGAGTDTIGRIRARAAEIDLAQVHTRYFKWAWPKGL